MPILTEAEIRERVRQPQDGMKLALPKGTIFSPSAADFIKQWHIEVTFDDPIKNAAAQPSAGAASTAPAANGSTSASSPGNNKPEWDKASVFPVNMSGEIPHCVTCGTALKHKPEHMTQLNAQYYVPKNNERIRLRGKLDTLQALCLMIGATARSQENAAIADLLEVLAAYCREMMSAEYNEREVAALKLNGLSEEQLRIITHNPQGAMGIPHLTPDTHDSLLLLWLNYLRCQVRETELVAAECYGDDGSFGLVQAMNRLSSAVYYVELLLKRGE